MKKESSKSFVSIARLRREVELVGRRAAQALRLAGSTQAQKSLIGYDEA